MNDERELYPAIAGRTPEGKRMSGRRLVKQEALLPVRVVGVIASAAALGRATRLRRPPDLFELRLDALRDSLGEIERALPRLRAPLIFTARHPAEGGHGALRLSARRALLSRFLDHAAYVDLELRSLSQLAGLVEEIRGRRIGLLVSVHHLDDTPPPGDLVKLTKAAAAFRPALFKIATRTDTPAQLDRLLSYWHQVPSQKFPLAAMGLGRLGLESRRRLSRLGSALLYASLGAAVIPGQPTFSQLQRARQTYMV